MPKTWGVFCDNSTLLTKLVQQKGQKSIIIMTKLFISQVRKIAMSLPNCPKCDSEYTYEDGALLICPMCAHEWSLTDSTEEQTSVIRDAVGNELQDGDSVTVIKDLKVKGSSTPIKVGTKVKNIRLIYDTPDDHDIDCKVDGFGAMKLKSSVVKKA